MAGAMNTSNAITNLCNLGRYHMYESWCRYFERNNNGVLTNKDQESAIWRALRGWHAPYN